MITTEHPAGHPDVPEEHLDVPAGDHQQNDENDRNRHENDIPVKRRKL